MGNDLIEAWGSNVKFISTWRPIEDSVRSLCHTGWWAPRVCHTLSDTLWKSREAFLKTRDHLRVDYITLCNDPATEVKRIMTYLEVKAPEAAVQKAIAFVRQRPT
jgi:hypothetical protein